MGSFRFPVDVGPACALLMAALVAGPVFARSECENLPSPLQMDAGRVELQRDGDLWVLSKGRLDQASAQTPSFIYYDQDDHKRIYHFIYRTGKQFSCVDTGRYATR